MDFGIKELGITLMVGAFTMLGFEAILHYVFNRGLIGFFSGKLGLETGKRTGSVAHPTKTHDKSESTMTITVFILLAFGIGVLAEDLSYKYVDSTKTGFIGILAQILPSETLNALDLPAEESDVVVTLVGTLKKPKPGSLAHELAAADALEIADPSEHNKQVQEWMAQDQPCVPQPEAAANCPSQEQVKTSFDSLYYYAKNMAYKDANHYDELKRIQARLEFVRSLSLISLFYFLIALITGLILIVFHWLKGPNHCKRLAELRIRVPVLVGVLFCIYFVSLWAFARETTAFDLRALGYLSTTILAEKRQRKLDEEKPRATQSPLSPASSQTTSAR